MQDDLHPAWQLLLRHPALYPEQQPVCTLLCVSKRMAAAVHSEASRQLACKVTHIVDNAHNPDKVQQEAATVAKLTQLASWLVKHTSLLQSLDLEVPGKLLGTAGIAAALWQGTAATPPTAMGLESFRGPLVPDVLVQLPHASLTGLVVVDGREYVDELDAAMTAQASLGRLTNLKRLVLFEDEDEGLNCNVLVNALSNLQQLTHLTAGIDRGCEDDVYCLPISLRELRIGAYSGMFGNYDEDGAPLGKLDFGHLTAVTKLSLGRDVPVELQDDDVLPPNVESMYFGWGSWGPAMHLTRLRELETRSIPATVARHYGSTLTSLLSVSVDAIEEVSEEEVASWSCLPLQSLVAYSLEPAAVPHLATLTGLTKLKQRGVAPGTWQELAAAVKLLTNLRKLQIRSCVVGLDDPPGSGDSVAMVDAVVGLPKLCSLGLRELKFCPEAAAALAAATDLRTQLTQLQLEFCSLTDYELVILASQLPALQKLKLCGNLNLSKVAMPLVAVQLQQLRVLDLRHTAILEAGLGWVTALKGLKKLGVCSSLGYGVEAAVTPELAERFALIHCIFCQ